MPKYGGSRIFFDIETDPYQFGTKYVWLISCLEEASGKTHRFLAKNPRGEKAMLRRFAAYCAEHEDSQLLSYSGSGFDRYKTIARMKAHHIPVPALLKTSVDLHPVVASSVALPTFSYRLKDVAPLFGFSFRHSDMDGWDVAIEYERAWKAHSAIPRALLEYNEDDVRALAHVIHSVEKLAADVHQVVA